MPTLTRRRFLAATLASTSYLAPLLAQAQDIGSQSLPEAGQPVVAGTRFVWFGASSSMPGERNQIEPDPNGDWVNRLTGQRFRQFETPGPAGAGFFVSDVLAAEGNNFLSWITSLLIHIEAANAATFIDANGLLSGAQNIGDFWIPPSQLAALADQNSSGLRVLRTAYPLGGRTYRAIRIQTRSPDGWSQTTYDLDTGLLLVASSTTQGSPVFILDPNNRPIAGAGNTLLTYTQFAGTRRTSLPGPRSSYPQDMRRLRTLTYAGTRGIVMAGIDVQVPPTPIHIRYDISSNAGSYLNARMNMSGIAGGVTDRLIPAGVIGSLWMNPETLTRYGAGQTIDQDPVTGVQAISVGKQDNLAFVALQTGLARQTFGYNLRSGLLTRAELRQQIGPATDILAAQLVGTQ